MSRPFNRHKSHNNLIIYGVILDARMVALRSFFLTKFLPRLDCGKSTVRVGDLRNVGFWAALLTAKNAVSGILMVPVLILPPQGSMYLTSNDVAPGGRVPGIS